MAFIQCSYFSSVLGMQMTMDVFIPQPASNQIGVRSIKQNQKRYPALYLLHGLSDDHTIWQRRTSLERYVSDIPMIVVMPNGHRSFYTNMKNGFAYETALTTELISICESFFPISSKREHRYVAGLSMGGYGAMKFALKFPDLYSRVISFSGVLDMRARMLEDDASVQKEHKNIFGNKLPAEEDLFFLAEQLKNKRRPIPKIQIVCGTEDFLYQGNIRFAEHLEGLGIEFDYREGPGDHNWAYWDQEIERSIPFLMN